jgi:tRNA modification GTPase
MDTIFALSSGSPPAAIAIIRLSGTLAGPALVALCGTLPPARKASVRQLRDPVGELIDEAMVIWLPGPATATGEDLAEFHLHGGRAVIARMEQVLGRREGLRPAIAGEFTRRAFTNGRLDLAEAEGLADLLSAETELQRQVALIHAGGSFSRIVEAWRDRLLDLSARLEAALDFSDEDEVAGLPPDFFGAAAQLAADIADRLAAPAAETLKEGFRVVLAGPPNSGKSTLFNAIIEKEAAITSPVAGTTRDVIEQPVALGGIPFLFVDTAGLRSNGDDEIEAIGIERAARELQRADLVLWLGEQGSGPAGCWEVEAQIDRHAHCNKPGAAFHVSALTGENLPALRQALITAARAGLPKPGEAALNARQAGLLSQARDALVDVGPGLDPLLAGEHLRLARLAFDRLIGRTATEDMLDALFSRFCIGK